MAGAYVKIDGEWTEVPDPQEGETAQDVETRARYEAEYRDANPLTRFALQPGRAAKETFVDPVVDTAVGAYEAATRKPERPDIPDLDTFIQRRQDAEVTAMREAGESEDRIQGRIDQLQRLRHLNEINPGEFEHIAEKVAEVFGVPIDHMTPEAGTYRVVLNEPGFPEFYHNRPGLDLEDADQFAAAAAFDLPTAGVGGGLGFLAPPPLWPVTVTAGFLGGAFTGRRARIAKARNLGGTYDEPWYQSLNEVAPGALLDTLTAGGGRTVSAVTQRSRNLKQLRGVDSVDKIPDSFKVIFDRAGVNPQDFVDNPQMMERFARELPNAKSPEALLRTLQAEHLPYPVKLDRLQAAGQYEGSLAAQDLVAKTGTPKQKKFYEDQRVAGANNVSALLGRSADQTGQVYGAGTKRAMEKLAKKAGKSEREIDAAYDAARKNTDFTTLAEPRVQGEIIKLSALEDLAARGFIGRVPKGAPKRQGQYSQSLEKIDKFLTEFDDILADPVLAGGTSVPWPKVNKLMTDITAARRSPGIHKQDAAALQVLQEHLERWEADVISRALSTATPGTASPDLKHFKKAAKLRKDHREMFESDSFVRSLLKQDARGEYSLTVNPSEAVNLLFNFGENQLWYNTKDLSKNLDKLKELLPKKAWEGIRDDAVLQLRRSPEPFHKAFHKMEANSQGDAVLKSLFSKKERKALRDLANIMQPPGVKSDQAITKALLNLDRLVRSGGFAANSPVIRALGDTQFTGIITNYKQRRLLSRIQDRAADMYKPRALRGTTQPLIQGREREEEQQ